MFISVLHKMHTLFSDVLLHLFKTIHYYNILNKFYYVICNYFLFNINNYIDQIFPPFLIFNIVFFVFKLSFIDKEYFSLIFRLIM